MHVFSRIAILLVAGIMVCARSAKADDSRLSRCRVVPQENHEVAFLIDGVERLRWHYGNEYPRPFFSPLIGPAGFPLTRMGHPGAPNHDHHRSIWFAHNAVNGVNYWGDEWMGVSVCRTESRTIEEGKPLVVRYLLHAHDSAVDAEAADGIAAEFAKRPPFEVTKAEKGHRHFEVRRMAE